MRCRALSVLASCLPAVAGCIWGPYYVDNDPLHNPQPLRHVSTDGYLELGDGTRARLAAIRMRPAHETKEPNALACIPALAGGRVEIERGRHPESVTAWYKQRIVVRCGTPFLFPHPWTIVHIVPNYRRALLSTLLIRTGLARYDPAVGQVTPEADHLCESAQRRYDRAAAQPRDLGEYVPLDRYVDSPIGLPSIRLARGDLIPEDGPKE